MRSRYAPMARSDCDAYNANDASAASEARPRSRKKLEHKCLVRVYIGGVRYADDAPPGYYYQAPPYGDAGMGSSSFALRMLWISPKDRRRVVP